MLQQLTKHRIVSLLFLLWLGSCIPAKKAMYFPDISPGAVPIDSLMLDDAQRVFPGDRVSIQIITKDEDGNGLLNAGGASAQSGGQGGSGYLIDQDGFIEIPTIGKVYVRAMTPIEIREVVRKYVSEYYVEPVVYCTISGKVTILEKGGAAGSSGGGGSGNNVIIDGRLTILEALAGTTPVNMKLDKVWIIRETDGKRVTAVVNLNSKQIFESPYYYLRNNDLIYIEPIPTNRFIDANTPTRNLVAFVTGFTGLILAIFALAK